MSGDSKKKYVMRISRAVVDKLGIKLYDNVSAAVAEIVANSYDGDAEKVTIHIPLGRWLATVRDGILSDRGYEIVIEDDGHGFSAEEANDLYLVVGKDRRQDPRQGRLSRIKKRRVLGRKGIGKLAPFGICNEVEVWSAGGEKTKKGYEITNFILRWDDIQRYEKEEEYHPDRGEEDGKYAKETGTRIILRKFNLRRTPDAEAFHRQLSRRYSIGLPDFNIWIVDTTGEAKPFRIGKFEVEILEGTRITVDDRPVIVYSEDEAGNVTDEVEETLPVTGWVAFSRYSYRDDIMAGIRIYTRGKLCTVTRDFGIRSGFTGENVIRSYLVGEIHAEWIDPDDGDDLIRTDRQDILWNTIGGRAFQDWGRNLLRELGRISRIPVQERNWYQFLEKTDIENKARQRLQSESLVERAMNLGKLIGYRISPDELDDGARLNEIADVVISCAPQFEWIDTVAKVSTSGSVDLQTIASLFAEARIGEIAVLGRVALQRLGAISRLRIEIEKQPEVNERVLQEILEEAPWLINPQWTVFGMTESFKTVRHSFELWYGRKYKEDIATTTMNADGKIPDFILLNPGRQLEIVEIKKRWHTFGDADYERLQKYVDALDLFLSSNEDFQKDFGGQCHAILICDQIELSDVSHRAFESLRKEGRLENITWDVFLARAEKAHQDFIDALDTQ